MPQTTASDKIASKEYLLPNFDANKLKMAELRNVLNLHGVDYSSCRTKPQLVQLFDAEVRTQHGPSPVAGRVSPCVPPAELSISKWERPYGVFLY